MRVKFPVVFFQSDTYFRHGLRKTITYLSIVDWFQPSAAVGPSHLTDSIFIRFIIYGMWQSQNF